MVNRLPGIGARGHGDAANQPLVPRLPDFEGFSFDPFLAAHQKSRLRSRAHFHGLLLLILTLL